MTDEERDQLWRCACHGHWHVVPSLARHCEAKSDEARQRRAS